MKTRFTWLGIVAACFLIIATLFVGCNEELNNIVTYTGHVVYKGTTTPFPYLEVKVTNGDKIHSTVETNSIGDFSILVKVDEINQSYYILVGDATCEPKRVELIGLGKSKVDLGTIEVEGPTLATVTTNSITEKTDKSATCGGNVTSDGRSPVTARGVCWSTSENPTIHNEHTENGSGTGYYTSKISGLSPEQTYYVRAYATNKEGTAYGEQITFSTYGNKPQVTTGNITNITGTSAKVSAIVNSSEDYPISACGVCWSSTTSTPSLMEEHTSEVARSGEFTSNLINLKKSTTYYVRAYASNQNGTVYGETKSFTTSSTSDGLPVVKTVDPADNVTETSIITGINVTDDGGSAITECGVVYSTSPNPTLNNSSKIVVGASTGYFSATINGVTPFTKAYYIRAYATNANGTAYGEQFSINPDYISLKTMEYGGYIYRIKFMGNMPWNEGQTACQELSLGGYSDWFMPSITEIQAILETYGKWGEAYYSNASAAYLPNGCKDIWAYSSNSSSEYAPYYCITYSPAYGGYYYWKLSSSLRTKAHGVYAVRKY
mgnify:CR=1 FL=1